MKRKAIDILSVDAESGELLSKKREYLRTPEEIKKDSAYNDRQKELRRVTAEVGNFIWILYHGNEIFDTGIDPADFTRFIYICTYIDYDGYLYKTERTKMSKRDMRILLSLNEKPFYNFYNNMIKNNMLIEDIEGISVNRLFSFRGKIRAEEMNVDKTRMYIRAIREIYENSKPIEHKTLSYVFRIIPFVNRETNIIAENIYESDQDKIIPMTVTELARKLGFDDEHTENLRKHLTKVRIKGRPVVGFVVNADGYYMFVNPRCYYAGSNYNMVSVLTIFDHRIKKQ